MKEEDQKRKEEEGDATGQAEIKESCRQRASKLEEITNRVLVKGYEK